MNDIPLGEELKNEILAFVGKPSLVPDIEINLLEIDGQNFGSKDGGEVLGELGIVIYKRAGQLGRIAVSERG